MSNLQIVPYGQGKNVKAQEVEMRVPLYSFGCERKIRKALSQIKGLYSVEADVDHQKVTVVGMVDRNEILEAIRAKRKEADFWMNDQNLCKPETKSNPPPANEKSCVNSPRRSLNPGGLARSIKVSFTKKLASFRGRN